MWSQVQTGNLFLTDPFYCPRCNKFFPTETAYATVTFSRFAAVIE